ncbi:protein MpDOXC14 [Marchantia polymorpha subsp. ruderalis]|uniref:Fe2OG dioxygenase domain-containing protein n=2 Tax=Marchantia polymorpha TaxID=3197 RepID=A0AAF6AW96_MARPO|nr:hypothetical protein MARPO_0007s0123 [Marchantia polymorpha]BBN04030.1 hypothetical protein Mp_3g01290 [Marchantia polymorpha subsp. ruderalis]|eukprot:PTQ47717.1 hypothetical protein MARPO_0007s0123 [Marchantia polymorpha]
MAPPDVEFSAPLRLPSVIMSVKNVDTEKILSEQNAGARGNALGDALATLAPAVAAAAEAEPQGALANAVEVSRMLRDGKLAEVPTAFKFPEQMRATIAHDDFCDDKDIPVIDLTPVWAEDGAGMEKLVDDIARACETSGFFHVVGHQVPDRCVKQMQAHGRKLFELPLDRKLQGSFAAGSTAQRRGYSCTPKTVTPSPALIWQEGFTVLGGKTGQVDVESYAEKIWPDDVEQSKDFSQVYQEYAAHSMRLSLVLKDLLIKSLKVDPAHFEQYFESPMQVVHLTYYPPSPSPLEVMGLNPHYDMGFLTLIAQDDVPGLQLLGKDGNWFSVRPVPGAFCFNVADSLEALSNGRFRSNLHRVLVNKERPRLSISTFLAPDFNKSVDPAPELVDDEHPRVYRPFTFGEYMSTIRGAHLDHITNCGHLLDLVRIDASTK